MCVCIYVSLYVCRFVYDVGIYVCVCVWCMHVFIYVYIYNMYVCILVYVHVSVSKCAHVCVRMNSSVYVSIIHKVA